MFIPRSSLPASVCIVLVDEGTKAIWDVEKTQTQCIPSHPCLASTHNIKEHAELFRDKTSPRKHFSNVVFSFFQVLTKDLGGSAKCSEFTEEICRRVRDTD